MIDFIKIIIKDLAPSILESNSLLDFYDNINLSTGQLKTTNRNGNKVTPSKTATYNGLEFKIYDSGTITLSGSLHIYWNTGKHNYNDFNIEAVKWTLEDLKDKFNIEPKNCILKCLEIGINIVPPISTNEILDYSFLHKTLPFEYQKNSIEGKYRQVKHSQYIIKLYNKALHYSSKGFKIHSEIMRFEIKYIKMQKLNEKGIFNIDNLVKFGLHNFKNELISEWQNVLFFDNTIQIDTLSKKTKNVLLEYSNQNYWTGLLNNKQTKNFRYHKNQLKKITFEKSNNIQDLTTKIMSKKIDFLNLETIQIDTLTIRSKRIVSTSSSKQICKVTSLDISMQKENSFLLSHTGLRFYHQTDKFVFEQIKNLYLSKVWINSDFEIQIREIAHNIRNKVSNQRLKQKRIYQPRQMNALSLLGL